MKIFKILLFIILVTPLYSQEDSSKYMDCSCICIKSLPYKTLPDSFKLGLKYPNPGAYNLYEYFSIPESSLVKFIVNDASFYTVKETDFCLLVQGNYQLSFIELLKPIEEFKSGVYYLEMIAKSSDNNKQLFKDDKKVLFVK